MIVITTKKKWRYFGSIIVAYLLIIFLLNIHTMIYKHDIVIDYLVDNFTPWKPDAYFNSKTVLFYRYLSDWISFPLSFVVLYGIYRVYVHGQKKAFFKIKKGKLDYKLLLKIFVIVISFMVISKLFTMFDVNSYIISKFTYYNFNVFTDPSYIVGAIWDELPDFDFWTPYLGIANIVLVTPIIEELCFRGIIFNAMLNSKYVNQENYKKMATLTIVVSSVIFALGHITRIDFNTIQLLIVYLSGSFLLGYLYYKTQNIRYTIFAHMCANLFVTFLCLTFSL